MRIAVLKERAAGESRVAATPETVKKFIALGASRGGRARGGAAGRRSPMPITRRWARRWATLRGGRRARTSCWACRAPIRRCWRARSRARGSRRARPVRRARRAIDAYAAAGLEALAMEFMPRITRAQSMDILSSQSNLAGYKAVIAAADVYGRAFPMMMTAAGTISAAKVFVMGVGVAGPAGDRHRAAAGRAGFGHRRALGHQGADPVARRQADLRRERRRDRGRGRGRLCHRNVARNTRRPRPNWSPATSPSRTSSSPPR